MDGPDGEQDPLEPERITLLDSEGVERTFLLYDVFDHAGETHYLVEAADDPDMVLLLRERSGRLEPVEGEELDRLVAMLENEEVE